MSGGPNAPLVAYVRQTAAAFAVRRGRIVFSGGWAGAAEGFGRPRASTGKAA